MLRDDLRVLSDLRESARVLAAAAHVSPEAAHLVAFEHEPRFMFPSPRKDQTSHDLCIIVFMNITCGTNH